MNELLQSLSDINLDAAAVPQEVEDDILSDAEQDLYLGMDGGA